MGVAGTQRTAPTKCVLGVRMGELDDDPLLASELSLACAVMPLVVVYQSQFPRRNNGSIWYHHHMFQQQ